MYKLIKDVLNTGKFNLSDMLKKIDSFWISGEITDDERIELYNLAQEKAKTEYSTDLLKKIAELENRLLIVEEKLKGEAEEGETPSEEEYPEFVVGRWYYTGNTITFEGTRYRCIAPDDVACVWSPKDYPAYWQAE